MAHKSEEPRLPSPEELAGRELLRLRKERDWSQEEVARRMSAHGFTWHQTTVGRTESAARPLRVNEAVALAVIFEVPVSQLLVPMTLRVADIDEEIRQTEQARALAAEAVDRLRPVIERLEATRDEGIENMRQMASAVEKADSHLALLRQVRRVLKDGKDVPADALALVAGVRELARFPFPADGQ